MTLKLPFLSTIAVAATFATIPTLADALRSNVAFNNSISEQTSDQPENGVKVSYQVTLQGGDLDGCTIDIVEALYGRDEGAWGIFDIVGDVSCASGSFSYTSSGSWDGNGFHASGDIKEGSGSGDFEGITGRVAQLGGSVAVAADESLDVSYELVVDKAGD